VLKVVLPLVFLLFADGSQAGGTNELTPPPVSADRSPPAHAAEDKAPAKTEAPKAHAKENASAKEPPKEHAKPAEAKDAHKEAPKEAPKEPAKETAKEGAKEAVKPAAHGAKRFKDAGKDGDRTPTPPPGISATAMNEEMNTRATQQKALNERERLEALSSDLSRTRSALREETVRLETLMETAKHAAPAKGTAAAAGAGKPGGTPGGAVPAQGPRTEGGPMPLGDPLAPSAYYRPAPPPPNFAVQVEVVSKAMKSMKPEAAAGILGHLERGLAAEVLQRMRPADAGAILGFLKPEVGAALAAEIVSRPPVGRKDKDSDKEKP
jgi:hypothetical protein